MTEYLFLSVHDFRSRRKTCVHFMTEELAKRGHVRFWSVGMSALSEYRGDTRTDLRDKANKVEIVDGVECYLQRGLWHPFRLKKPALRPVEEAMFSLYRYTMPPLLKKWIREADEVFIESGMAAVYIADVRRLNPRARIVYWAADDLTTIGAAETIRRDFLKNFDKIDIVRLTSPKLLSGMPHARSSIFAPHGMNKALMDQPRPSPFGTAKAGVSVGSMLFDPDFFNQVASAFPDVQFHVIGAGKAAEGLTPQPNVIVHDEMPFENTLAYLRHAAFGIAPYRDENTPDYLIDTSLKLKQFAYFGKPAVCPEFALGNVPGRCGYIAGRKDTMVRAVQEALDWTGPITIDVPEWSEVADRILEPERFPQYRLTPAQKAGGPAAS